MKTLTTLLALATLCATAYGQTIKSLGYNTTNGQVVANTGTNLLTFTNLGARFDNTLSVGVLVVNGTNIFETGINLEGGFFVDDNDTNNTNAVFIFQGDAEDQLRANARRDLGIPLPALTNTSNADMLSALGAAQTIFTVKTNDQTIIDETNATTITDLTFATEPGARYVVTFFPIVENGAFMQVIASNALVFGNWNRVDAGFSSTNPITNEAVIGTTGTLRSPVQVFYVEGGTNAGAISATFRGATNSTNTIKAGSFLRADKMP
jgi:hypothetical protein